MPASYLVDGRWAFSRDCAWWAFRTVSRLANFRFQEMSKDIEAVWKPIEDKAFADQAKFEEQAAALFQTDPKKARELLTRYSQDLAVKAVAAYWKLGDDLWLKYSGNF